MRRFKKFLATIGAITMDIWHEVAYFVQINMRYVAVIIEMVLPYAMYMLGQDVAITRKSIEVGGEVFIPVVVIVFAYYVREFANKSGKGNVVPIPNRRFTEVSSDGEVSVDNSRIQELLLYMADLEDYMERKGWL